MLHGSECYIIVAPSAVIAGADTETSPQLIVGYSLRMLLHTEMEFLQIRQIGRNQLDFLIGKIVVSAVCLTVENTELSQGWLMHVQNFDTS